MGTRGPRILEIELSRELSETPAGLGWFRADAPTLFEVEEAIRRASRDPRIAGLVVKLDAPQIGWSKAESLHRALLAFRRTGKPSVALLSHAASAAFLAAVGAERVVVESSSTLDVQSLASESVYFKDLLGDLGVDPDLEQVGEFKSAGEMFQRREASESHREQIDAILSDLQASFVEGVALARGLARQAVSELLRRGPFLPEEALAAGLVDAVEDYDSAGRWIDERLSATTRTVSHRRYLREGSLRRALVRWRRPRIAVVHAVGVITSGEDRGSLRAFRAAGARSLGELLGALRRSRRVKAVVLRIESPGGGAVASDRIRRQVELTGKGKPVVVSMGDVAASGGYYLATAASAVVAEGSTLTGSIGVIGGKFVVRRLLDRLGIHRETRSAGGNAGFFSPLRSYTDDERRRNRAFLTHFYEKKFLSAVAEGRKLDLAEADRLGRGRIWTGRQARERGLVDQLGGLEEAIALACAKANVPRERARVSFYAPRRRWRELVPRLSIESRFPGLGSVADAVLIVEDLAREELLLLMPRLFRIR